MEEGHAANGTKHSAIKLVRRSTWAGGLTFVIMIPEPGVDGADEVEELQTQRRVL